MFYVDHSGEITNLDNGTEATFYVPFLVQSAPTNTQLLIPVDADF